MTVVLRAPRAKWNDTLTGLYRAHATVVTAGLDLMAREASPAHWHWLHQLEQSIALKILHLQDEGVR